MSDASTSYIAGGRKSEESDIVISGYNHHEDSAIQCGMCYQDLSKQTINQRQLHYDDHFKDDNVQQATTGIEHIHVADVLPAPITIGDGNKTKSTSSDTGFKFHLKSSKQKDVFWYPACDTPPPHNFTPGFVSLIKKFLLKSHAKGNTRRGVLCYERAVLVSREFFDVGWGCGYRNYMMACSVLMDVQHIQPMYFPLLDAPISPGVRNLQQMIEMAWNDGFDAEGAAQLERLIGTKKWIGTADLWVAFTHRGIPAQLVDFHLQHNPRGIDVLIDWIVQYFSPQEVKIDLDVHDVLRGACAVTCTEKVPLILQHNGHSRTIIGYEIAKNGDINLLSFDPSYVPPKQMRMSALACAASKTPPQASSPPRSARVHLKRNSDDRDKDTSGPSNKRARSHPTSCAMGEDDDDEVIIVADSRDTTAAAVPPHSTSGSFKAHLGLSSPSKPTIMNPWDALTTAEVLKPFRISKTDLKSHKRYQILFFPLTAPLTDLEKAAKTHVVSRKIS